MSIPTILIIFLNLNANLIKKNTKWFIGESFFIKNSLYPKSY